MATENTCTLVPYFQVHEGELDAFKKLCGEFLKVTKTEAKCLYYNFSFDGDLACCIEAYQGAEGVLAHVANVDALFGELLQIADLARIEVHGPEQELAKLREPMADLNPQFFIHELGFSN